MVLPVLVGGVAAITAMASAALNPSGSGDDFVSGNGRVKATGHDDHRTRKQGITAAATLVQLTHVASTAPSTPKPVVEMASESFGSGVAEAGGFVVLVDRSSSRSCEKRKHHPCGDVSRAREKGRLAGHGERHRWQIVSRHQTQWLRYL